MLQSKIGNVLVHSNSIDEHWKHLYLFLDIIKRNGLIVSTKMLIQESMMNSCQCFIDSCPCFTDSCPCLTDVLKGNIHSAKILPTTDYSNIINVSSQESEHVAWINTADKWSNNTYTTYRWNSNNMSSLAQRKNKGKALA